MRTQNLNFYFNKIKPPSLWNLLAKFFNKVNIDSNENEKEYMVERVLNKNLEKKVDKPDFKTFFKQESSGRFWYGDRILNYF